MSLIKGVCHTCEIHLSGCSKLKCLNTCKKLKEAQTYLLFSPPKVKGTGNDSISTTHRILY